MHLFRTKFKNGVVAEFLPPLRHSNKVIILCDGLPSVPSKRGLLRFLSKKGFWVFHIRYQGTWESEGEFLVREPQQDVLDIVTELPKGFTSLWDTIEYKVVPEKVFVIGSSFGGCSALMSSINEKIDKVVAISPVVDWTARNTTEPDTLLHDILRIGYGGAYRFRDINWDKLQSGTFFNPISHREQFDNNKCMIIHALDDEVVSYEPVEAFAEKIGCMFISLKKGGHLSSSLILKWKMWRKIKRFLLS